MLATFLPATFVLPNITLFHFTKRSQGVGNGWRKPPPGGGARRSALQRAARPAGERTRRRRWHTLVPLKTTVKERPSPVPAAAGVAAVDRALTILDAFTDNDRKLTLAEIAKDRPL